jgi:hypothetical protein
LLTISAISANSAIAGELGDLGDLGEESAFLPVRSGRKALSLSLFHPGYDSRSCSTTVALAS